MTRLLGLLVCALALLPVASASAATDNRIRVYKVTAEGSGNFTYDLDLPAGDGLGLTSHRAISFGWKVQLPSVAFLSSGEGIPVSNAATAGGSLTASATE